MSNDDILQLIPYEQLPKLQELFKHKGPHVAHVYNLFGMWMRHKLERPTEDYVSFYCPNGDFNDGSFIAIIEIHNMLIFTWDRSITRLKKSLVETKRIDWKRNPIFYAMNPDYFEMLNEVTEMKEQKIVRTLRCHMWWLPREIALEFHYEIPNDLYVAALNPIHITQIHSVWPHRTQSNINYLRKLLELNKGIGLFLKHNNVLIAWAIKNSFNGIGILQTADEHKQNGYGALITKIFSKMLAEKEECDLAASVMDKNTPSRDMFRNIGFRPVTPVVFVYT